MFALRRVVFLSAGIHQSMTDLAELPDGFFAAAATASIADAAAATAAAASPAAAATAEFIFRCVHASP